MKRTWIIVVVVIALALAGAFLYRQAGEEGHSSHREAGGHAEKEGHKEGHEEEKERHEGHDEHGEAGSVRMSEQVRKENGVVVAAAARVRLGGGLTATGKVEANADRIAHVSPRIPGKIVAVRASLGDSVGAGQVLATLDSVELGEALNRYQQSKSRLVLAESNMERVQRLVEKKIAPRKDILQAETEFKTAQAEVNTDLQRLSLYGLSLGELKDHRGKPLLPVRSPIGGIITEKHAIVGELADPSRSLYTVADLSSVWVMVDIHEKDLAKVRRGQAATVVVTAYPEPKLKGRVTYLADVVDPTTRTVKARIEVANPARKLKPEMFATVELSLAADTPPVIAVPEEAVQELEGKKVVFVTGDGVEFKARQVEPGRTGAGLVEIAVGLKEGERYAAKGAFLLKSELKKGEIEGHDH